MMQSQMSSADYETRERLARLEEQTKAGAAYSQDRLNAHSTRISAVNNRVHKIETDMTEIRRQVHLDRERRRIIFAVGQYLMTGMIIALALAGKLTFAQAKFLLGLG